MFKSLRKPSVVGIGAVIVLLGLAVGIVLYKSHQDRIHYQSSLHRLSGEIETVLLSQKELAKQLAESEEQSAGYRQRTDALLQRLREERERLAAQVKESQALFHRRSKDIAAIESQLNLARRQIRSLESADAAGERIIRRYHGGVAFIEVTYAFEDAKGRKLRFADLHSTAAPARGFGAGRPSVSAEAKGAIAYLHSSGTGFVVKSGFLLTNRHVTEPWMAKEGIKNFAHYGFRPVRASFRAFFPGVAEPFVLAHRRSSDQADLVLLSFDSRKINLPVLALDRRGRDAVVGRPVILLGYPTGLQGLVARVDAATLKAIAAGQDTVESTKVTEELSRQGRIQPLVTWGHLSAIQQHQLTYDALTTSGGSGGPVISVQGRVIGINYAVQQNFGGANYGIPVRSALELLE